MPAQADRSKPAHPKLHDDLTQLRDEQQRRGRVDEERQRQRGVVAGGGRVTIAAVASGSAKNLLDDLNELGLRSGHAAYSGVTGRLPLSSLDEAESLGSLRYMSPDWVASAAGSVQSEGDAAMKSDDARSTFGVDGSGVRVGTLSDSFDCIGAASGPKSASADVASGDLPSGVTNLDEGPCPLSDEGRAMIQHIHDVAPGASLSFHNAFEGQQHFAQGIIDLMDDGADIINDDVFYFAEPWMQDGVIAKAVDTVSTAGVAYFSLAGNQARRSYESPFRSSGTIGQLAVMHDFDPGAGVDTRQRITVFPNSTSNITLQWSDPFGAFHSAGTPQTDLDFFVFSTGGTLIGSSTNDNPGVTDTPFEFLSFVNNTGTPVQFDLQIEHFGGPVPTRMKWLGFQNGVSSIDEFTTISSTLVGHQNAENAISVGASFWNNTPEFGSDPASLEIFSSAGGTTMVFDETGNRLARPFIRHSPDIVAPDGANNTFFGSDIGGTADPETFPNFFGTSAATPHAAAVGALLLDKAPTASPIDICNALTRTADDMAATGYDLDAGHGFVDAPSALGLLTAPGLKGPCKPGIRVNDVSGPEDGKRTFAVTLNFVPTTPVLVRASTLDATALAGQDYLARQKTILFKAGQTKKSFAVPIVTDNIEEANEKFRVVLAGAENGKILDASGDGRIVDND